MKIILNYFLVGIQFRKSRMKSFSGPERESHNNIHICLPICMYKYIFALGWATTLLVHIYVCTLNNYNLHMLIYKCTNGFSSCTRNSAFAIYTSSHASLIKQTAVKVYSKLHLLGTLHFPLVLVGSN